MEQFDKVMRDLSLKMARTTTRRGFLTRTVQASVGLGLAAGTLFGSGRRAFADSCGYIMTEVDGRCASSHADNCNYRTPSTSYLTCQCGDGPCENCPDGYSLDSQLDTWACCCGNRAKRCTICTKKNPGGIDTQCAFSQLGAAC